MVFLQSDHDLISCVNSLEKGNISQETVNYIKSLEKNIQLNKNILHLFSRYYKKKLFNNDELKTFPESLKVFESHEGDSFFLAEISRLGLKVGCSVMLVVYLSESLVNGSFWEN